MIVSKVNTAPFFGRVCSICLLGSFVFVAVSAILQTAGNAQTADLALQTPQLAAAIESLQAQIDELRVQQTAMKLAGRNDERAPEYDPAHDAKNVSWLVQQPGAAGAGAAPSYPTARLTGFFQTDAVGFDQDAANIAVVGDVQNGADFRRARLAAVGDVWDNVSYNLELDFAFPGRPSFMDVWLDVHDAFGGSTLRVGQFRQPLGMDELTSVKELTFLERALPFALFPFRQIGMMAYGHCINETAT